MKNETMQRVILVVYILCIATTLSAQQLTQTIRGSIVDASSSAPVPYATVRLKNTKVGVVSDRNGNFLLTNIPVGRHTLTVTSLGYEPVLQNEVPVTSVREVVLTIRMKQSATTLDAITVLPQINKAQALNSMSSASSRMLSVEEAQKYAGGFDDPARLVSAFAGVSSNVANNAIIVRGNNPQYLQWKIEGIEVSNPNHFANLSSFGGGGLTALSTQVLDNSDFFSGAMPAEYNNALSGVFDIFMRTGNSQKNENTFQLGAIGIDVASEGSISRENNSSFLFNYRYSTLGLLAPLLPENAAGTTYQDLSFKVNFPTRHIGTFSLWGMGLLDHSDAQAKSNISEWQYDEDRENEDVKQYMGILGLTHISFLDDEQFLKTTLAVTGNGIDMKSEKLDSTFNSFPDNSVNNNFFNYVLSSYLKTKFNAYHSNKTGVVVTNMHYSMLLETASPLTAVQESVVDTKGNSTLLAAYTESQFNLFGSTTINAGLNVQWFTLGNDISLEPRIGVVYQLSSSQKMSLAYGKHSRLERLNYYFITDSVGGTNNNSLGFSKAQHVVLGYDISTSEFTHLSVETYWQYLYNIPVVAGSSFSLINQQNDWFLDDIMQPNGKGLNYGIDVTFEKYLSDGYYYLTSISIFESQYKGGDNQWRSSRYNRNYAVNALFGKEWTLGKEMNHVLGLNVRISFQGGNHHSPIDNFASLANKKVVYDETNAFTLQYDPSFTSFFTATYRINGKSVSHELALKVINLTQYKENLGYRYNYQAHTVDVNREATFIPNLSYKIEF